MAWEIPTPGDIVWCLFPEVPRDVPGPKPRPALILSVEEHEDGLLVTVAYGTSQKVDRLSTGEFAIRRVANEAAFDCAGLSYDTKFDLKHQLKLPWNDLFFAVPHHAKYGQTPKMGMLHIMMYRALEAAARAIGLV